jgi:hypothetical protein
MKFALAAVSAYLINVNPRAEIHGEDKKPAGDLKIKVDLGNECLAMFAPTLKHALYHFDKSVEADLVDKAQEHEKGYAPHIRFPFLPAIKWEDKTIGAQVTIHQGIPGTAAHDISLDLCNVDNFQIEPKQGGTCSITFRVQAHPSETDFGKLCAIIGCPISLSIAPPEAEQND